MNLETPFLTNNTVSGLTIHQKVKRTYDMTNILDKSLLQLRFLILDKS